MKIADFFKSCFKQRTLILKWTFIVLMALTLFTLLVLEPVTVYGAEYADKRPVSVSELESYGYTIEGDSFRAIGSDPQFIIYPKLKSSNRIEIEFAEPFRAKTSYQLYTQYPGFPFSEEYSSITTVNPGTDKIVIDLPSNAYTAFRIDINADFSFKSITVAETVSVNTYTRLAVKPIMLVLFIAATALFVLFKTRLRDFFRTVIERLRKSVCTNGTCGLDINAKDKTAALKTANLFFCFAFVFGLALIFITPPFTAPDEYAHYLNLSRVYNGYFFPNFEQGKIGCFVTRAQLDFYNTYDVIYSGVNGRNFSYSAMYSMMTAYDNSSVVFYELGHANLNPFAYLLPALFARLTAFFAGGLSPYSVMLCGKIANLSISALIIRKAIKETGILRNTIFLLALMPMTLYQCASLSYDAILIAAMFLLFAYVTKLLTSDEEYVVSIGDIIAVVASCALVFGTKYAYATVILLLLTVPFKKFKNKKHYFISISAVAVSFLIFYAIPLLANEIGWASTASPAVSAASALSQADYFTIDRLITIICQTWEQFGQDRVEQFFGVLGLLDTRFATPFAVIYLGFTAIVAAFELCCAKSIGYAARLAAMLSVGVFMLMFLRTIYISWTPVFNGGLIGGNVAHGGQGRYYIPLVPFALLPFSNGILANVKGKERVASAIGGFSKVLAAATCSVTVLLMLVHYWL